MLTIVNAYYCNEGMLAEQYRRFMALPEFIRERIEYIVTDDSTPEPHRKAWGRRVQRMKTKVFHGTGPDIPWNYAFARNVGCKHASYDNLLVTDIDHVALEGTLWRILNMIEKGDILTDDRVLYKPTHRILARDGSWYKPHPDTYLCTKRFWCDILGYHDERFRGGYGGDYDHKERILARAKIDYDSLDLPLLLHGREVVSDASTFNLERKSQAQKDRCNAIRRKLKFEGTYQEGASFLSPYEQVWSDDG